MPIAAAVPRVHPRRANWAIARSSCQGRIAVAGAVGLARARAEEGVVTGGGEVAGVDAEEGILTAREIGVSGAKTHENIINTR